MKHRGRPGPPSEPCQSCQWKCLFEHRDVVMAAPALLPRHSQDLRSQKRHHRATAGLQRWRKWGKVQIRATVALRVRQVKHQHTERGTGSNLPSEPRHLPLAGGTHGAGNMPAHTCTQPWQRPSPNTACATETGLQNYPGELFIPVYRFLFSKSHAF